MTVPAAPVLVACGSPAAFIYALRWKDCYFSTNLNKLDSFATLGGGGGRVNDLLMDGGLPPGFQKVTLF